MSIANGLVNNSMTSQLISYPIVGAAAGLGFMGLNKMYSQSLYGSSMNDPFMGDGWDFVLTGAGWGHGVGLCQIGAAMMGAQGFTYDEILQHYFRGVRIEKLY